MARAMSVPRMKEFSRGKVRKILDKRRMNDYNPDSSELKRSNFFSRELNNFNLNKNSLTDWNGESAWKIPKNGSTVRFIFDGGLEVSNIL